MNEGSLGLVEMLFRSNCLALVGGGRYPRWPPNKVVLWDDAQSKVLFEIEFKSEVKNVRLRRDLIFVALLNKVFVYTLGIPPRRLSVFDTGDNPKGLLTVSTLKEKIFLAFPGRQPGHVQMVDMTGFYKQAFETTSSGPAQVAISPMEPMFMDSQLSPNLSPRLLQQQQQQQLVVPQAGIIAAHTTALACIKINASGTLLASASEKVTFLYLSKERWLIALRGR